MATLFGIDNAYPITPDAAHSAGADVVCVYIGGVNNGGWRWEPQHAQALRDAGFKLLPIYVGANVGYNINNLGGTGGTHEAEDALACLRNFGFESGPIAFDYEYGTWENQPDATAAHADSWAQSIADNGYFPVFYGTVGMAREYHPVVPTGFWVAAWNNSLNKPDINDAPIPDGVWTGRGWQYTDAYNVGGHYDGSVFEDVWWQHIQEKGGFGTVPENLPGKETADKVRRFFPETGHSIAYGFRAYWEHYGDLMNFGFPLSEEFVRADGITVQYFERARFEWHPGKNPDHYDVLLGRLGSETLNVNNENHVYSNYFAPRNFE